MLLLHIYIDDSFNFEDLKDNLNEKNIEENDSDILTIEINNPDLHQEEEKPTVCDEMSTTSNTDMSTDIPMSDPHWDGYTVRKLIFN